MKPGGRRGRGGAPEVTSAGGEGSSRRVRLRVHGVVQGVGFRPFVYRLATELGLAGLVRNDASGVLIEAEANDARLEAFIKRLRADAPALARVDGIDRTAIPARGDTAFAIAPSGGGRAATMVPVDAATCADCLRELFDPADRRHRYPFTNCTNCGPRFTIVLGVPYDRPRTTMAGFRMCAACRREYEDPADRRFHAQPNACPACGPKAALAPGLAQPAAFDAADPGRGDALRRAATALKNGAILAVKGLGGFHLACRADSEEVVARLRARKYREDKPFALMVADVAAARALARLDDLQSALLRDVARPIVLASRVAGAAVARAVAPRSRELGLMLPYTPLHHLLLADMGGVPLVMTSGNRSDEPIAYLDDDARDRLGPLADLFLTHDRPIRTRTEDSVARVVSIAGARRPMTLRRSRGFVPAALPLPAPVPRATLGCGAELKNTFGIAVGDVAWLGPHIGDLRDYEALRSYRDGVAHLARLLEVEPPAAAHDLHPEYLSTKDARDRCASLEPVQHHHAHLAACLAEHGEAGPALGVVFDGTGLGADGTIWGGELLLGDVADSARVGHLWPVRMPGGEAAIRQPWRMACAWLTEATGAVPALPRPLAGRVDPAEWNAVARLSRSGLASPLTTSAGRLFDAIAALAGVRTEITYEGQAAVELEAMVAGGESPDGVAEAYRMPLVTEGDRTVIDARPAVLAAARDADAGAPVGAIAGRFHAGLADAVVAACGAITAARGVEVVVLSGGAFQNVTLLERVADALSVRGLRVLVPGAVPPNDGGICYGQLAAFAARHARPSRSARAPRVTAEPSAGSGGGPS